MMNRSKLVVVGNGMAGIRTLEELLALAPDRYDITVFGAEPHPNYNRILLSPVLAGEQDFQDIVLNPLSWYEKHGIALRTGTPVARIDRRRRVVIAADGAESPTTACCWLPDPTLSSCRYRARTWTASSPTATSRTRRR